MAYSTSTVLGLNAVYDALLTFATANGWTLDTTVSTRDKVIKSTGTDGKLNMVYRLTASTEANNPFAKAPYHPMKKYPAIFCRGYHRWTGGSGFNEFGSVGPWIFASQNAGTMFTARFHRFDGATFPIANHMDLAYPALAPQNNVVSGGAGAYIDYPQAFVGQTFDGLRKFWGGIYFGTTQTVIGGFDLVDGRSHTSSANATNIHPAQANATVMVHDAATDKDYIFTLSNSTTLADHWWRYDIEADTWTRMTAPPWSATAPQGGVAVWDGSDTIYALRGNGTTDFAKYSISGNTWTSLTAAPVARNAVHRADTTTVCGNNAVYIPTAVTGIGQDVIYTVLANTGTVIYRYRVTDNAWDSTSGTGALTAQFASTVNPFALVWDHKQYLYQSQQSNSQLWYRSDLSVAPNTWTNMGNVQSATAGRAYNGAHIVNHLVGQVRSNEFFDTEYHFFGDGDAITVVLKVKTPTPHYYWMYFGRYDTFYRTNVMTLTGSATAGTRVTVNVDSTTNYNAGDVILIWDPGTGTLEKVTIYDIPNGTSFRANLVNSYTTGARAGVDPTPWCIAGCTGLVSTPLDAGGYRSDNEDAVYALLPALDLAGTTRSSPTVRGFYAPVQLAFSSNFSTLSKYENRGTLKRIFSLLAGAYPKLQQDDTIKFLGKTYKFFTVTPSSKGADTRGIVIGPID